jgi:hypothetical protein
MLTALRVDARATDAHSNAMAIHTYASPSAKPRDGDDDDDDVGAGRQCAKFTIWNDFGDKENVDPVTATTATRRRSKDCTPSRPPLTDITRRFTPPVRREEQRRCRAGSLNAHLRAKFFEISRFECVKREANLRH